MTTSSNSGWKGCGTAAVCSIALKMNPNTSYSSQIQSVQPITKCFTRSQKFSLLMNLLVCSLLQEVYSCSACYLPCSEKPRSGRLQINKAGSECSRAPGAAWNQKHTCRACRPPSAAPHSVCYFSLPVCLLQIQPSLLRQLDMDWKTFSLPTLIALGPALLSSTLDRARAPQ